MDFSNENREWYSRTSIDSLKIFFEGSGLQQNIDLELIFPFLSSKSSILEVGVGFGRVVRFLLNTSHKGSIDCVEPVAEYAENASQLFNSFKQVSVINKSIFDMGKSRSYDCIFLLWSTIIAFSYEKQKALIRKINSLTRDAGLVFIDTPVVGTNTQANIVNPEKFAHGTPKKGPLRLLPGFYLILFLKLKK